MTIIRRAGAASGAVLSALVLAVGAAQAVAPRWLKGAGLDVWNYPAVQQEAREIKDRDEILQVEHVRLMREIELTKHIATRLAAEKTTLREAVDQLAPFLEHRTGFTSTWMHAYRAPSFRHGVARYVLINVARALRDDPSRWAAIAAQLEAEYAALE